MHRTSSLFTLFLLTTSTQIFSAPIPQPQAESITQAESSSGVTDAASRSNGTMATGGLEGRQAESITEVESSSGVTAASHRANGTMETGGLINRDAASSSEKDPRVQERQAQSLSKAMSSADIDRINNATDHANNNIATGSLPADENVHHTSGFRSRSRSRVELRAAVASAVAAAKDKLARVASPTSSSSKPVSAEQESEKRDNHGSSQANSLESVTAAAGLDDDGHEFNTTRSVIDVPSGSNDTIRVFNGTASSGSISEG